ncbi:MAG TPA: hypothetical protein VK828_08010 [Terriglobales bacterium]|jgi:hypothetical protein|nr:hypothetical protein [Terriglobales bacterium]
MRFSFRSLLPTIQGIFLIVLLALWTYTLRQLAPMIPPTPSLPEINLQHADARSFDKFWLVDGLASYWSVETNLPAMPVVVPLYWLVHNRIDVVHPFNTPWRILGFGFAGIGLWFFVGRFVDDVLASIRRQLSPRSRTLDVVFFVYVIASSLLVLADSKVLSFVLHFDAASLMISALFWLALGFAALLLQVRWVRTRRACVVGTE